MSGNDGTGDPGAVAVPALAPGDGDGAVTSDTVEQQPFLHRHPGTTGRGGNDRPLVRTQTSILRERWEAADHGGSQPRENSTILGLSPTAHLPSQPPERLQAALQAGFAAAASQRNEEINRRAQAQANKGRSMLRMPYGNDEEDLRNKEEATKHLAAALQALQSKEATFCRSVDRWLRARLALLGVGSCRPCGRLAPKHTQLQQEVQQAEQQCHALRAEIERRAKMANAQHIAQSKFVEGEIAVQRARLSGVESTEELVELATRAGVPREDVEAAAADTVNGRQTIAALLIACGTRSDENSFGPPAESDSQHLRELWETSVGQTAHAELPSCDQASLALLDTALRSYQAGLEEAQNASASSQWMVQAEICRHRTPPPSQPPLTRPLTRSMCSPPPPPPRRR
eukprot:COSAG01_NODE_167_length_23239_cov_14.692457_2_plen_401_part_00